MKHFIAAENPRVEDEFIFCAIEEIIEQEGHIVFDHLLGFCRYDPRVGHPTPVTIKPDTSFEELL
ncbi:MAG: hypothetical protein SVW57_01485 [Thermodesulfobacteriota bacterium]|nr:hypothetical protein [Thermodesulfobacteriota bacterium]